MQIDKIKPSPSLIRDFELDVSDEAIEEAAFIQLLSTRIAEMLQYDMDLVFSTLYRLDILETKLNAIFKNKLAGDDIPMSIAKLIVERQKEKNISRKNNPVQDLGEGEFRSF